MSRREKTWPLAISGAGVLLGLLTVGEVLVVLRRSAPAPEGFFVGVLSAVPFVLWLAYGGYWVRSGDLSAERYPRIGYWTVGALAVSLVMNVAIMLAIPPASATLVVGWLRWAAAIGGGVGLLIGVFEARAIDRRVAIERSRARREATERENARLEEFASTVSHDLRNPLNVAVANIDRARSEVDSEHLANARAAMLRMNDIVQETLTLARRGRTVGEADRVDLGELAEACWRNVETPMAALEVGDVGTVRADADRTRHLFENLYRNAVEHGGDDVTVRVGPLGDGFFVEDDGPGIPEEERGSVLDAGYSTSAEGSGLGLAIARQIVEAHDWEIAVTEAESGGARFEVTGVEGGR